MDYTAMFTNSLRPVATYSYNMSIDYMEIK